MPTKNPRINIPFDKKTFDFLAYIAQQEEKSLAGLAKELILEALETREDIAFSRLAEARDVPGAPRVSHEEFWKTCL